MALEAEQERQLILLRRNDGLKLPSYADFEGLEQYIAGELDEDVTEAALRALQEFDAAVVATGQLHLLEDALTKFELAVRDVFGDNLERVIRDRLDDLIQRGAVTAGLESGLRETATRNRIIAGMLDSAKHYTREHVTNNIMPRIYQQTESIIAGTDDARAALRRISDEIADTVAGQSHKLHITANQSASRAYHYGVVKGGYEAGFRYYEFQAILDEHTSAVCESLNGRVFEVADAIENLERRAMSSPEDLPLNAPWFTKTEQITGLDGAALSAIGANMPPLHPFCRSSIRFVGR